MPTTPNSSQQNRDHRNPPKPFEFLPWLTANVLLVCVFAVLVLALLAEMPWIPRPTRTLLLSADVVLLFTLIAAAGTVPGRLTRESWRGVNLWLVALLAWSGLCAVLSPYHAFAIAEILRLALGAGVYFAAAYVLRPHEVRLLPYFLIGLGAAVGLYGLVQFGQTLNLDVSDTNSIFGNHEQLGSFLTLLFAPALALALDRERPTRELLWAQGTAVVIGAALLLARTRSAWIGAAVSLVLLSALSLRYSSVRLNRSNRALFIGPALIVLIGFGGLLVFGQLAPLVSKRASSLSHALDDTSFSDRLHRWRSAARMASERPVTGWGLGSWPVMEGRWTHQGDDVSEVLGGGTGHSNLAHNYWVQWAAETGGVGLALYAAFLTAFFMTAFSALPRLSRDDRTLLIACLVGVAAGIADMVGAPSYTFPGVSSLFWLWLGLGLGVMGVENPPRSSLAPLPRREGPEFRGRAEEERANSAPDSGSPLYGTPGLGRGGLLSLLLPLAVGLAAAFAVIGIGDRLRAAGNDVPRGTLSVTVDHPGPVKPGTRVLWTATYHAPDGSLRPTAPGTVWTTDTGSLEKTSPTYISVNRDPQRSGFQGNVPAGVPQVTLTAHYRDNFSREYRVSKTVTVK